LYAIHRSTSGSTFGSHQQSSSQSAVSPLLCASTLRVVCSRLAFSLTTRLRPSWCDKRTPSGSTHLDSPPPSRAGLSLVVCKEFP
jgi:hypothetical protein